MILYRAAFALLFLFAVSPSAADTFTIDFGANNSGYTVTVLNDGASNLSAGVANGRLEVTGFITTFYKIGAGAFVPFALEDTMGNPAPDLDPATDWMLNSGDELDVTLLFSATRAAIGGDITSSFTLLSGDVSFDNIVLTGTLVPEPSSALLLVGAACLLGGRRRRP